MQPIDLIGHVDDRHQLHVELFDLIPPGPVRVIVSAMTEQYAEDDWRGITNSILARDWADQQDVVRASDASPSLDSSYAVAPDHFENSPYIEQRVGAVPPPVRGSLRTVLSYLYMRDGPTHLPPARFKAALWYLEPVETILARWLRTRTDGRLKKGYGVYALKQARVARYRCETCGFADVRALHLDHVHGLRQKVFACLCANCHNIKSRQHDWSGKKRYTEQEEQGA
jgi:hypothetical protein